MAEKAINDISAQKEKVISADYIQDVVSKYFNINKKQTGFIIKYFDEPSLFILWQ